MLLGGLLAAASVVLEVNILSIKGSMRPLLDGICRLNILLRTNSVAFVSTQQPSAVLFLLGNAGAA